MNASTQKVVLICKVYFKRKNLASGESLLGKLDWNLLLFVFKAFERQYLKTTWLKQKTNKEKKEKQKSLTQKQFAL